MHYDDAWNDSVFWVKCLSQLSLHIAGFRLPRSVKISKDGYSVTGMHLCPLRSMHIDGLYCCTVRFNGLYCTVSSRL